MTTAIGAKMLRRSRTWAGLPFTGRNDSPTATRSSPIPASEAGGAGFIEAVSGSSPITILQTGHGYIAENTAHISSSTQSCVWAITVTDANHYQLGTLISGGYTPNVGDATFIDLQTCTFNPSTVTPYLAACFNQAAGIMSTAGLTPWLQFGEFL